MPHGQTHCCARRASVNERCSGSQTSTQAVERSESTCWTVIRNAADGDREARGFFAERYDRYPFRAGTNWLAHALSSAESGGSGVS